MSKAFVKEGDDADDDTVETAATLPAGAKNYMTPPGFARLQEELRVLLRVERPKIVERVSWAAGNGDRSENGDYIYGKKRLYEIDRRVRYLSKRLESAQVVDATVTYVDESDVTRTVKIVGIDEADIERGHVSWISPVARALLKARRGDTVDVQTPAGKESVEVLDIRYGDDRE
jgi:transcription elongation factor GreB